MRLNIKASIFLVLILVGALALTSATRNQLTVHDKAFYANEADINFVRPGLEVKILSAEIATDGTVKTRVKFTDPNGLPLDKDGITTPGAISAGAPGMIVATIPSGQTQFTAYTTRTQNSTITGKSAIQAGTDSGGVWEKVADGEYSYTFRTKAPSGYDRNAVHAIGVYANRILTDFEMGTQLDDDVYYFVPATGKTVTNPRDMIRTGTCQKCHGANMAFHGETGRTSVQMCDLCHTPQTTDPDTGNTVDMNVMVHKIHMGEHLPSVAAKKPYQIIGFGNSVNDYSTVAFPSPIQKCEVCHEEKRGAAQPNAFLNPNRAACGSCHDNVNFATGENHANLPQISDSQCKNCHTPEGELDFDVSIKGAHVVPQESKLLTGLTWKILKVDDGVAGKKPIVTFSAQDKAGNGLPMSAIARVALTMAGPTTDYTSFATGYVSEDASKATPTGAPGTYTYTFATAIPATAKGTFAIGLEGRRVEIVLGGTTAQRSIQYGATNPMVYFSVDGSKLAERRKPTANANCLNCHYRLALHGENRINNVDYCVMCHNPVESDAARRPAAAGAAQTIDMKFMAHRIHGGEELNTFYGTDYSVYGFGGTAIGFAEVRYPAPLNECTMCHVNGSENASAALMDASPVKTARYPLNPTPATTTACYGCHDSRAMLSHAVTNTTALGESCSTCHSSGADFSATKEHASEVSVNKGQSAK